MDIAEAIAQRHSCRTYNGLRLDKPTVENLEAAVGRLVPLFEAVSRPVIKFVDCDDAGGKLGTYGFITGARQFIAMAVAPGIEEHVQAGYMFEQLVLEITGMGLGSCWLGGTFRQGPFGAAMGDCGGRSVEIVSPVGHATPKMRFAERMMRRAVKSDRRKPFAQLFDGIGENTVAGKALEAVRLAPSSSNSQPWRAKAERKGDVTEVSFSCISANRFSGIDMGIAYCHFTSMLDHLRISWRYDRSAGPLALRFLVDA